jgi:hypothetical protein
MGDLKLKDVLAKFLKGEEIGKYPRVEAHILCLSPLQITDDFHRFIDVSSLEDSITEELEGKTARGHKLILQDWKFVLRRIPNSHEYYFDLAVKKYELVSEDLVIKPEHEPIKMEDDEEIRYLFETRKRQEIEKMVRAKDPNAKDDDAGTKSASKQTVTKLETALPTEKNTEAKEAHGTMTSEEFKRTIFAKPSIAKTEDKKSPVYLDSSFFRKSGVIATAPKFNPEDLLHLTISELMSVPAFIPPVKRSVIRFMPPIRVRRSTSSESIWEDYQRESMTKMVTRYSVERESRMRQMNFEFEDVHECIRAGLINWDQLIFNRNAFEYLQANSQLLENTE